MLYNLARLEGGETLLNRDELAQKFLDCAHEVRDHAAHVDLLIFWIAIFR